MRGNHRGVFRGGRTVFSHRGAEWLSGASWRVDQTTLLKGSAKPAGTLQRILWRMRGAQLGMAASEASIRRRLATISRWPSRQWPGFYGGLLRDWTADSPE